VIPVPAATAPVTNIAVDQSAVVAAEPFSATVVLVAPGHTPPIGQVECTTLASWSVTSPRIVPTTSAAAPAPPTT